MACPEVYVLPVACSMSGVSEFPRNKLWEYWRENGKLVAWNFVLGQLVKTYKLLNEITSNSLKFSEVYLQIKLSLKLLHPFLLYVYNDYDWAFTKKKIIASVESTFCAESHNCMWQASRSLRSSWKLYRLYTVHKHSSCFKCFFLSWKINTLPALYSVFINFQNFWKPAPWY